MSVSLMKPNLSATFSGLPTAAQTAGCHGASIRTAPPTAAILRKSRREAPAARGAAGSVIGLVLFSSLMSVSFVAKIKTAPGRPGIKPGDQGAVALHEARVSARR